MTCLPNFPAINLENQKFEGYKTCLKYQRCICPLKLLPDIFKIPKMRTDIYIYIVSYNYNKHDCSIRVCNLLSDR